MSEIDEYFSTLDAPIRAAFDHIRNVVMEMVPEAESGRSYGMAALKYRQKPLLGFLASRGHLSIFPFSPKVVDAVRDQLTAFEVAKGTIRFTLATPLLNEVVREIVRQRTAEIAGSLR